MPYRLPLMLLDISINGYPLYMIAWNLFLAAVPCVIALKIAALPKKSRWFPPLFLVWLFFLPNTVYLLTIVRHLLNHCQDYHPILRVCFEEAWMPPFFFAYALAGLFTFVYAMNRMTAVFRKRFGKTAARLMPIILMPVIALGTLFGLLDRLNSWDIVTKPLTLVPITLSYFTEAPRLINWAAFTVILYAVYYATLYFLKKTKID